MILCFDGGGSKCRALLADDDFNLIGEGAGLGVNTNHTPYAQAVANMRGCVSQTMRGFNTVQDTVQGTVQDVVHTPRIDAAYLTVVGPLDELARLLEPYHPGIIPMSEPEAALWAGILVPRGYVALSGTGSDVFFVTDDERRLGSLGGWGLLLGDEGSGAWIGQQALRAVARDMEDVGPRTKLTDMARDALGVGSVWDLVRMMYGAPSYVRFFGEFTPRAARAATDGDEVALGLFREAGEHMARYMLKLRDRVRQGGTCVLSGGAWKAHPAMFDTFANRLAAEAPEINVRKPYFEPVMAGVSRELAKRHPDWDAEQRLEFLSQRFPSYRINWI